MATSLARDLIHSLRWRPVLAMVLLLIGLGWLSTQIEIDRIHDYTEQLDGWLVFVVITVLPLLGFPVTPLHLLAGMRWGPQWGLTLVALSILLQLLASFGLVRLFRPLFARKLARFRERIPAGAHGPVTLFTALLPGVPYFAKNYLIPVLGVPLRTFLLWCFPLHALRASVAVLFGHESDALTPARLAGFTAYFIAITLSCGWAFRRLRAEVGDRSPAGDGPKRDE